jgi:uncharacterized coiled-coil DUF342 family protein
MTGKFTFRPKPEEQELSLKRQELQTLENQLVERELYLVELRGELSAFEKLYLKTVGVLYAELDEIEAQIAEVRARREPSNREAQDTARDARARAEETRTSTTGIALSESVEFSPPPSLKSLYREVARRIHPDLAGGELDRAKRQRLMADANKAYEDGDEARLRAILEEYESSPETVQGEGTAPDLVRVIRKIAQVRRRLREIEEEAQKILKSEVAQLKSRADEASKKGRELLAEMAEAVQNEISRGKQQLSESRRVHP